MAAAIAHNFNNQLQSVIMGLELALQDLPRDSAPVETLSTSLEAARNASNIGIQMLTYLGQSRSAHELLDLATHCRQALLQLKTILAKNIALESNLPAVGPQISANVNELRQILTELIANAAESIGDAGGTTAEEVVVDA